MIYMTEQIYDNPESDSENMLLNDSEADTFSDLDQMEGMYPAFYRFLMSENKDICMDDNHKNACINLKMISESDRFKNYCGTFKNTNPKLYDAMGLNKDLM